MVSMVNRNNTRLLKITYVRNEIVKYEYHHNQMVEQSDNEYRNPTKYTTASLQDMLMS